MVTTVIPYPQSDLQLAEDLVRRLQAFLKATPIAPDRVKTTSPGKSTSKGKGAKIRCPHCKWQPAKADLWGCECGCSWNTFDTHGLCPQCGKQWTMTACLSCHVWSAHEAWYEPEGDET